MESARWQGQIGWNALLATARTGFVLLRCALLTFQFPKRKAKLKRCSCLIHIWNNRADWLLLSIRGPVFKLQLYTLLCRTHIKARPPPDPFDLNSFFSLLFDFCNEFVVEFINKLLRLLKWVCSSFIFLFFPLPYSIVSMEGSVVSAPLFSDLKSALYFGLVCVWYEESGFTFPTFPHFPYSACQVKSRATRLAFLSPQTLRIVCVAAKLIKCCPARPIWREGND